MKSTVEEIRARFDNDVERFSNLETGQSAVIDSPLCMDLVASAAAAVTPEAQSLLDIGCGAGNYTLKVLEKYAAAAASSGRAAAGKVAMD
jgi:tRNA (cmo5U34)-methyltransferase